jgi:hypothetical protein
MYVVTRVYRAHGAPGFVRQERSLVSPRATLEWPSLFTGSRGRAVELADPSRIVGAQLDGQVAGRGVVTSDDGCHR